uniref:DDE Tnp4 domain-containing protein n=2 Tax=Caenorhabditis japonica TaxID=281687 RepID=A0A8R1DRL6_CAEJA
MEQPPSVIDQVNRNALDHFLQRNKILNESGNIEFGTGVSMETFEHLLPLCMSQNNIARDIGIYQPTICRIIREVTHDLSSRASEYIKFPQTRQEIRTMQSGFFHKRNSDGNFLRMPCFGVLDGKHWSCKHPPHSGSLNANYKGLFSFNSFFVCDSESRIIYVQISELGIHSDAQLFKNGPLPLLLEDAQKTAGYLNLPNSQTWVPAFLLADNGFAPTKTVMQPYRKPQLASENLLFNEQLSRKKSGAHYCGVLYPQHHSGIDGIEPPAEDPYLTPECLRSALKHYLLYQ